MRLPLVMSIIALLLGILIDIYIYRSIPKTKRALPRLIYCISAILTLGLLIVVFMLPKRDTDTELRPVMWLLYTWTSIYISKYIYGLFLAISSIPRLYGHKRWPVYKYVGLPAAIICFGTMWWGVLYGRYDIAVSEITVNSKRLPASFDGIKIAQFSDAHVGTWGQDTTFVTNLVNKINALNPDIIVFTGDIVNRKTDEILPFVNILKRLKAPLGVYSVMGNHDYGDYTDWPDEQAHAADTRQLRAIHTGMGWNLLCNTHKFIYSAQGDSIAMIGVENWGEPPFKQYGDLKKAYPTANKIGDNNFKILLSHNPMHWHNEVREYTDIDLTLSGHTHAMQVLIGGIGTGFTPSSWRYPEWGGLYTHEGADGSVRNLYVNIGCGEVAIPARIGASPEITLITLHSK